MALNYNLAKVYALSDNDKFVNSFVCYRSSSLAQIKEGIKERS
jgi:hypothetical protein